MVKLRQLLVLLMAAGSLELKLLVKGNLLVLVSLEIIKVQEEGLQSRLAAFLAATLHHQPLIPALVADFSEIANQQQQLELAMLVVVQVFSQKITKVNLTHNKKPNQVEVCLEKFQSRLQQQLLVALILSLSL